MAWTIENTGGKQWRIVSPDGQWWMQPEGQVTADEARHICEVATRTAAQAAGERALIHLADRLRATQRAYLADRTETNGRAVGAAALEYDHFREGLRPPAPFDLVAHLERQRDFSLKTFGPGPRTKGVVDHIRKELAEIEADPADIMEWVDVIILAFDGAWRAGWDPQAIVNAIVAKQTKNEARQWPDWRTADPDKAIEHVRTPASEGARFVGMTLDEVAEQTQREA